MNNGEIYQNYLSVIANSFNDYFVNIGPTLASNIVYALSSWHYLYLWHIECADKKVECL